MRTLADNHLGTSPAGVSTPPQEIGWEASEQYSSRIGSPAGQLRTKRSSSNNMPAVESPLRKPSVQSNAIDNDDVNTIHIDARPGRGSKITGGGDKDGKFDLGPHGGNTAEAGGIISERGFGVPILASDEVIKRPGSAYMQPAVSPEAERSSFPDDGSHSRRGSTQPTSRPNSRPNSMHAGHGSFHGLHRFISHDDAHHGSGVGTPLEEIEEYEPLFSEEDEKKRAAAMADKLKKRPGLAQHHFPSQDIWEDTPDSLRYTADVDTPEEARAAASVQQVPAASLFESPEKEQNRITQNPETMLSDNKTFAKPHFKPGVQNEHIYGRPGINRFPSSDIWEDSPDSMRLETTVGGPQEPEIISPQDDRPTTTGLYHDRTTMMRERLRA
jgi:hypothetical protein